MEKRTVVVSNATGVHLRPSGLIAKTAETFEARITLRKQGDAADAKSIMEVMTLGMMPDDFIDIEAEGPDEESAAEAIAKLFKDKFGEWSLYD